MSVVRRTDLIFGQIPVQSLCFGTAIYSTSHASSFQFSRVLSFLPLLLNLLFSRYLILFVALKRNLEKDVEGDTSGDYKRVLIALLQGQREDKSADVSADCQALYAAGEGKTGTDESAMDHDLVRAIHKETSGNFRDALETIVRTALNKSECIAEMLLGSMKGLGTRDDDLIRLVLAYSEDNLEDVKRAFAAKNGKTLGEYIRGETSGDYKKFLLAIVGK
ncbi:unnamed protein product [Dibothriocephalus latus]|uniref:Annexin n=1 Tax=Dibothriocephalus latus TaxID=60516 RepID=A0A3P7L868_DIBLA|nr:unnamed protein product [Dibothriocephalus latus]